MQSGVLQTPIVYLKGVGPNRAETLKTELGIETYGDLLQLYPNRYLDKTQYYKINQLQASGADVQVVGKIVYLKTVEQNRGKRLEASFVDETGELKLVWFRSQKWLRENLKINQPYVIFGRVNRYGNSFSMPHPEMELLKEHQSGLRVAMQPIYPSTEKLSAKGITNRAISKMIQQLFLETKANFEESLSPTLMNELKLLSKADALLNIHFPKSQEVLAKAQFRLKFEELFFITEILAQQHYNGLKELVGKMEIKIALLTGSTKRAERTLLHNQLENGNLHILVGTHAILEDKVQFKNLGLAVIDEQHRFGVAQRSKLWKKRKRVSETTYHRRIYSRLCLFTEKINYRNRRRIS